MTRLRLVLAVVMLAALLAVVAYRFASRPRPAVVVASKSFTGIRLDDFGLILEGAVPSALLAIAAQALFGVAERIFVPRGLRLKRAA